MLQKTLPERLRDDDGVERAVAHDPTYERQLRREAAAEIDRLRALLRETRDCVDDLRADPEWLAKLDAAIAASSKD
jgi:hypothetical protein